MLVISVPRFAICALVALLNASLSIAQRSSFAPAFEGRAFAQNSFGASTEMSPACAQATPASAAADTQQGKGSPGAGANESRSATWHTILPNLIQDQKHIFVGFPNDVVHGRHWIPVLAIAAASTGMIVADQYDTSYFRRTSTFHAFNSGFSGANTAAGIVLLPIGLYSAGYLTNNSYAQQTAFFAAEAGVDAEVVGTVMKLVTRRERPSDIAPHGNYADTFFDAKHRLDSGFPSDHVITAFSVATVVSRRYGHRHRWVPIAAYGLAAAVGFSRISGSAHFPADVFLGAALGYSLGRFVVLQQ